MRTIAEDYTDHTITGTLSLPLAARTGATCAQDTYRVARISATKSDGSNLQSDRQVSTSERTVAVAGNRSYSDQLFRPKQFRNESAVITSQGDSMTEDRDDDLSLTSQASDQQIVRVRRNWSLEPMEVVSL